jgi:RHH-type proline utilization regulon transcriptional repressor/proline dehydrogenase/delta 1-pyrroline-5-carboxylate dehydrogenase
MDLQRVFALLPPDRPAGEAAFRLAEALPRTPDRASRIALLKEYVPALRAGPLARIALPFADLAIAAVGGQFVYAQDIEGALRRARRDRRSRRGFSFDMLGEGARTADDAERNLAHYAAAIEASGSADPARHGVSIKLSSIHERYDAPGYARSRSELLQRLKQLCRRAAHYGIGLTIDAEESERLPLHLDLFEALAMDEELKDWQGLGLALQAYQTGILETTSRIAEIAKKRQTPICVRLVKGAYWDAEIRRAQELGLDAYPVFTSKEETDRAYVEASRLLLSCPESVFPQFATHNPHTLGRVLELAGDARFECQRLHGMGIALERAHPGLPMRIYAPVGPRRDLLAYLVRRLLENGASTSYVRQAASGIAARSPAIALPRELHMPERTVARGYDLGHPSMLADLAKAVAANRGPWESPPAIVQADRAAVAAAITRAHAARLNWASTPLEERAAMLDRLAQQLEGDLVNLVSLCVREAGKTLADSVADVREAVDFCRYYAQQARRTLAPVALRGPEGETNVLTLHGRGVFACISPWNFPVAIFCGQVAAALVAGNAVVAKPAEQTPLTALRVVELARAAGVPMEVLQFVPGDGGTGAAIVADARIAGVAFTGSNEAAKSIERALAARDGPIVPLIAETGGLNAMIVDSTALPEQVVDAVVASAFRSAGQRCSSLRMLYLQEEIAPAVIGMLRGAVAALRVGDPADPSTDVGPVIDEAAHAQLADYIAGLRRTRKLLCEAGPAHADGCYIAPVTFEVDSIRDLPGERFGPVLHVARFKAQDLDTVLDDIAATGYGLTLGVHTRLDSRVQHIRARSAVGNLYVNRNMIGAVVGVQPFGGEGLSGTGPKAGGPHYLGRFATERTTTINTAAAGGDLKLMTRAG